VSWSRSDWDRARRDKPSQYGIDFVWSGTTDYVMARHDALVSIATRRSEASAIEATKRFDPVRYGPLNFTEDGLNSDIIGQVGRLLRTKTATNPLNGYDITRMYAEAGPAAAYCC
jgi:hypothetical protein